MLTSRKIIESVDKGDILISPFFTDQVQPCSYDLRLDYLILEPDRETIDILRLDDLPWKRIMMNEKGMWLEPGKVYLGGTMERIGSDVYGISIEGKSTLGRAGLSIHCTAGHVDVGFHGKITLEISCIQPVRIYPSVRICQAVFWELKHGDLGPKTTIPYSGNYQNQTEPTTPRSASIQ